MQAITFSRVALVVVLLAAACLAQPSDFVGEWTDTTGYGGSLFICQNEDPTTISGKYSNAGMIQGTLDHTFRQATGRFFEGGLPEASCKTGTFDIVLDTHSQSFHGYYICADDSDQTRIDWNEDRVATTTPDDLQCAKVGVDVGSFDGVWAGNNGTFFTAICVDGDSAQLSYPVFNDEVGVATHEFGSTHNIIYGYYFEVDGFQGSSVWYLDTQGFPVNFFWEGYDYVQSRSFDLYGDIIFEELVGPRDDNLCFLYSGVKTIDWSGTWTDDIFGGEMEICTTGGELSAIYTEGGFAFGLVGGFDFEEPDYSYGEYVGYYNYTYYYNYTEYYDRFVADPFVSGSFFEGGDGSCTSGDFEFTMADDGMSFTGCFSCNDDDDGCVHAWDGARVSRTRPSDSTCGRLKPTYEDFSPHGKWSTHGAQVDFCEDDDDFTASGQRASGFQLYEEGNVAESGRVAYGTGFSSTQDDIRSLYLLAWDNSLVSLLWFDRPNEEGLDDLRQHARTDYTFASDVSGSACSTFEHFKGETYVYVESPSSSSDASSLAVGATVVLAFLAALF